MAKRQIDIKLDNDDVAIAAGDFAARPVIGCRAVPEVGCGIRVIALITVEMILA